MNDREGLGGHGVCAGVERWWSLVFGLTDRTRARYLRRRWIRTAGAEACRYFTTREGTLIVSPPAAFLVRDELM
ncbi:MAG: hypothetical protein ABIV50_11810 [Opitutus sp.]